MTIEESQELRKILLGRVRKEVNLMDCPYCGCMHRVRFSLKEGEPIFDDKCCDGIMRDILRIKREVFNEA